MSQADAAIVEPVYVHTVVRIRPGKTKQFVALMAELEPLMAERGLRLLGSFKPVTGSRSTVVNLWVANDAATACAAIAGRWPLSPTARPSGEDRSGVADEEVVTLMTAFYGQPRLSMEG